MYAEQFGIQAPSDVVENAAKWIQWVQAGVLAGAAENDATIRFNLNQFWSLKQAAYPIANGTDQAALDRLDTFAHGFWNALETAKIYASSPGYWAYWTKFWTGGTPARPEALDAATAATAAAIGMQTNAAASAANPANAAFASGMTNYAQIQAANVAMDVKNANSFWNQLGVSPLGVPLWAWALGAVALFVLLSPSRN